MTATSAAGPSLRRLRIETSSRNHGFLGEFRHFELLDVQQLNVLERSRCVEQLENAPLPFAIRVLGHASQRRHALHEIALDRRQRLTATDKDSASMFDF